MIKRVLITGCYGYLSSNLINYLDKRRYKINCIGRNLNDKDKIKEMIKDAHVIVHLAAIINPFDKNIWNVNLNYTKFLIKEAKKYNKRFIYLSTQNVLFGKDNYSKSKRKAEIIVRTLEDFVILRPTIIYGKSDRYIGRLIKIIKTYPIVPILGNGKNKLQPIYLEDLIKIIEVCINSDIKGIFLVAGNSIITYDELTDLIIKKLGLIRRKIYIPVWLIKPFAYLSQNLSKNPRITTVQLDNLKIDQVYDIEYMKKIFNIKLKDIEEGLDLSIKND